MDLDLHFIESKTQCENNIITLNPSGNSVLVGEKFIVSDEVDVPRKYVIVNMRSSVFRVFT